MQPLSDLSRSLETLIGVTAERHKVISGNIANVNTPGYRTLRLSFSEALQSAGDDAGETEPMKDRLSVEEEAGLTVRTDGNNVDIEREIGRLGKNQLLHRTFTELLGVQLDAFRRAIQVNR